MLVVKIELWPKGDAARKTDLAVVAIANVGGDAENGDYEYAVSHQAGSAFDGTLDPHELLSRKNTRAAWKRGKVKGYARRYGAVRLLHWALRNAFAKPVNR